MHRLARPKSKGVAVLPAAERILLVDMGVHLVVSMKDPATLIQLGVPGLELRMLYHPPLRTHKCISVGEGPPGFSVTTMPSFCALSWKGFSSLSTPTAPPLAAPRSGQAHMHAPDDGSSPSSVFRFRSPCGWPSVHLHPPMASRTQKDKETGLQQSTSQ